ncbi:DNA-processing protein DprA [Pseudoxanthomonas winnipegensis]|uniref:DNA-processing protein DprA n=1 Tax=Pseudoxanthomonas winnipegensis TaxID=2480810 RepID=UPI0025787D7D|nr:DNA-processing protein DprA [Pseudoxanthomonas winnipegensis]WJI15011.1 DNA-processing protein DprA [Pseudoxanthomonas winnipegensis]
MDDEDTRAWLALVLAGGATAPRRQLVETHGSAAAALAAGPAAWSQAGLEAKRCARLDAPCAAALARCLAWLAGPRRRLLHWGHADYPPLLAQTASPPLALFVEGDADLLWHPGVAVVGSRAPTAGGRDNAADFAHALASAGWAVLSGMAAGIDAAAHEAALALADGRTVAVVGTGPDLAYPAGHARLRARLAERGAVVSEFPPGTRARAPHFPSRNRVLAGLALGTVVIEAAERSGALITARLAAEAGREVFALPGSIHNPMARGCHRLIRDGATLIEHPREILEGLAEAAGDLARGLAAPADRPHPGDDPARTHPDPDYQRLWEALGHDPTGMDQLVARTRLTTAEVSSMLLVMELDGQVAVEHGRYARRS